MVAAWMTVGPLTVDADGHLWSRYKGGFLWLGPIADADVEPELGAAYAALLDAWNDRIDSRAEQLRDYMLSVLPSRMR